jgi:cysteine desulfuration protein SufE
VTAYPPRLQALLDTFSWVEDADDRGQMLVAFADRYRPPPPDVATPPYPEELRVPYCESEAYVWARPDGEGGLNLFFAVENPQGVSAKALCAVLQEGLSGYPAQVIAEVSPEIVYELFGRNISMGKGQGLTALVQVVQARARRAS